jgi:hypothetical protein
LELQPLKDGGFKVLNLSYILLSCIFFNFFK